MAFTTAQQIKIRFYLGFAAWQTSDSTLESAMAQVGGIPAAQVEVELVLSKLVAIEAEIDGLHSIALADKVEESKLNPYRYQDLAQAGRREVRRLSVLFGNCPIRRDVFGGGWSGGSLPMG